TAPAPRPAEPGPDDAASAEPGSAATPEGPTAADPEAPTTSDPEAPTAIGPEAPPASGAEAPTASGAEAPTASGAEAPAESGAEAGTGADPETGTTSGPEAGSASAAEAGSASAAEDGSASAAEDGSASAAEDGEPPGPDAAAPRTEALSLNEHAAFREIARALGARFAGDPSGSEGAPDPVDDLGAVAPGRGAVTPFRGAHALARNPERGKAPALDQTIRLLDRLPVGVLVSRGAEVLLANRHLLALTGYDTAAALAAAGGPGALFPGRDPAGSRPEGGVAGLPEGEGGAVALATRGGSAVPVGVAVSVAEWDGAPASVLTIRRLPDVDPGQALAAAELDLAARDGHLREIRALLDAVTDGVVTLDEDGRIVGLNAGAVALLGREPREVTGEAFGALFTSGSQGVAESCLHRARGEGGGGPGEEVVARTRDGDVPFLLTVTPVAVGGARRFSAVLRDVSAFKRTEVELTRARREAERASAQKSDFLATISHEVRTPLNAIIGFAEVMLEEQFGPVGNERYRDYLRDIRASGEHVVSLVNDLLDLAKIEAGHLDLTFAGLSLNDLVAASVALMQPQAARQRVVMRTSFAPSLPAVLADARSVRQAALNVISNAIKFTDAGGQVIVSTASTDRGGVALRVRDTGIGMTEEEIETALQPFRQLGTAQTRRGGGTGLGLPLTKALIEANRASLRLTSRRSEGTLVEVLFPAGRVLEG
uniref:histidine kinase dimerization/phospho-acceptor domain-containing protein n=1 Tax=Methylobacterium crusticola TaxID=1697972 RepID=UPI000FFC598F